MAGYCGNGQHWFCAHSLMCLCPMDGCDKAWGCLDDIPRAGVPETGQTGQEVEGLNCCHNILKKSQAHWHGRAQYPQAGREEAELMKHGGGGADT